MEQLNSQVEANAAPVLEVGEFKHELNTLGLNIYQTTDYDMFKPMVGNRQLDPYNIKQLIESMNQHGYLTSIVVVNEKMEVADGQHRIEAARETGTKVLYVIAKGYDLSEVQVLNSFGKKWTRAEYLESYCARGVESYLKIRAFHQMYPMLTLGTILNILALSSSAEGANTKRVKNSNIRQKTFESGEFVIENIEFSVEIADHLCQFADYYNGYNKKCFASAIVAFMKNKNYVPSEMIHKVSLQPASLVHCATEMQYKEMLEGIYNYKRKTKSKVSLAKVYGK
jgi:hypothetical protein